MGSCNQEDVLLLFDLSLGLRDRCCLGPPIVLALGSSRSMSNSLSICGGNHGHSCHSGRHDSRSNCCAEFSLALLVGLGLGLRLRLRPSRFCSALHTQA